MTQYNTLNEKLSNSKLNNLNSLIQKWNWSNLQSFIKFDSNDEINFPHDTQVSKTCKSFTNASSVKIKLSKSHYLKWYNQEIFFVNYL